MEKLNKGEFIVIKFEKKLAHAKVIAHVPEKGRLNVFTQGTLKWINDTDYVSPGEKGSDLKKGTFITDATNAAAVKKMFKKKETTVDIQKEIASLGGGDVVHSGPETPTIHIPKTDIVDHGAYPDNVAQPSAEKLKDSIVLTETDEMYLAPFRKGGKSGKTMTVEQVSDAVGKSTPATKHAVERLASMGYLDLINAELHEYALSIKGLKHIPGNVKPASDVKKLKTDKKSGEVELTKKDRVLTLLKNPNLTVKEIAETTGASQSYIRGVRERAAKKMDVPEKGSVKRAVYDALRAGGTLVDVAKRCKVTISYAYQIRQQMLSAKII
jgi:DNA-binding Lrp family transcriptional regulator